jgi:hypothetical protein
MRFESLGAILFELDPPTNTPTRSLLGLGTEVGEFIRLVMWPANSVLVEVDTTEI